MDNNPGRSYEAFDTFDVYRRPDSNSGRVIITTHGSQTFRNSDVWLNRGQSIRYYARDGATLKDPGTCDIAFNLYVPRETLNGSGRIRNYRLSHFSLDTPVYLDLISRRTGVDIISVTRNTTLKHILKTLNRKGYNYQIIDAVFCRTGYVDSIMSYLKLKQAPYQYAYPINTHWKL